MAHEFNGDRQSPCSTACGKSKALFAGHHTDKSLLACVIQHGFGRCPSGMLDGPMLLASENLSFDLFTRKFVAMWSRSEIVYHQ